MSTLLGIFPLFGGFTKEANGAEVVFDETTFVSGIQKCFLDPNVIRRGRGENYIRFLHYKTRNMKWGVESFQRKADSLNSCKLMQCARHEWIPDL